MAHKQQTSDEDEKARGYDAWFKAQVEAGLREADNGEFVDFDDAVRELDEAIQRGILKGRAKRP